MYRSIVVALGAASVMAIPVAAAAQDVRVYSTPRGGTYSFSTLDGDRPMIGVSTSTGSVRDTLGILISSVVEGSPAEKAGLEEGNRIAAINGVSLKLAPADVGDWDMASAMSRRLTREIGKLKAGDEVDLRVYAGGQTRAVKLRTVSADSLYPERYADSEDNRAVLGVSLGSSGSRRDTLGVLITALNDSGPAAKAGLEEGNRIVSINGVDLRVAREDAGDATIANARASRLRRELAKVKPGDEVALRVYVGAGRTRDLRLRTAAASDLNSVTIRGFGGTMLPFRIQGTPPEGELRRRLETELERGRAIQRVAPSVRINRITI